MSQATDPYKLPAGYTIHTVDTEDSKGGKQSAAKRLIEIARTRYRFAKSSEGGGLYGIPIEGPNVAADLDDGAFDDELAAAYYDSTGDAASGEAISSAMKVLRAAARKADAEPIPIRVAAVPGEQASIIDIGDDTGRAIRVSGGGWEVLDRSPIPFRRTALTGAMPIPERGGTVEALREFINLDDRQFDVVIGWMLASWRPETPCPILLLSGGQGTGKSSATRLIARLVDPTTCEDRQPPRDNEQLITAAQGSRLVLLDNVSAISNDLSDSLCRLCTGGGFVKRKLYTNGGMTAASFRRAAILNSIEVSTIRGDFAERMLVADLTQIPSSDRRLEEDLTRAFCAAHAKILGALLDRMVGALSVSGQVELDGLPRMADFARLLAAMDKSVGTESLHTYSGQELRLAEDVLDSSGIAPYIIAVVEKAGTLRGKASEILSAITPAGNTPKELKTTARKMSGEIRRLKPALEAAGYRVQLPTGDGPRQRVFEISKPGAEEIDHEYEVVGPDHIGDSLADSD